MIKLEPREHQIVKLAAMGLNDKTIAACLCLQHGTVMWYFKRMLDKFSLATRSQLIAVLMASGEIKPDEILIAGIVTQRTLAIDGVRTKNTIQLENIPID